MICTMNKLEKTGWGRIEWLRKSWEVEERIRLVKELWSVHLLGRLVMCFGTLYKCQQSVDDNEIHELYQGNIAKCNTWLDSTTNFVVIKETRRCSELMDLMKRIAELES